MWGIWESLSIPDRIQTGIASATFLAVLVALFGERFWKWVDRPKIKVSFDRNSDRCFRWADVSGEDNIQNEDKHRNVKRQYFRLKVTNNGGVARNLRVRVDIFDINWKEVERFEPSTLSWINRSEVIDLARAESEYVNFLSQVLYSPTKISNRLRIEVFDASPRGIAWDRPLDSYNFRITIYGENTKPKVYLTRFQPPKDIGTPGKLEEAVEESC